MLVRRASIVAMLFALVLAAPALAHGNATPVAESEPDITMVLVEHATNVTYFDNGDTGPSAGDLITWGPDALFDESTTTDTGATTQGICTAYSTSGDCILVETIVFADGSTLELQGIQPGEPITSTRTIVAGSGIYLGAKGTVTVEPTSDLTVWTKTFEIWLPA